MPDGYAVSALTVLGGALLGLGAYVNKACVFGAIARLGSGEWSYAVTPLGFYVGCLTLTLVMPLTAADKLAYGSPVLQATPWIAAAFVAFVAWRLGGVLLGATAAGSMRSALDLLRRDMAARAWSPGAATTVIGITFLLMLLLMG